APTGASGSGRGDRGRPTHRSLRRLPGAAGRAAVGPGQPEDPGAGGGAAAGRGGGGRLRPPGDPAGRPVRAAPGGLRGPAYRADLGRGARGAARLPAGPAGGGRGRGGGVRAGAAGPGAGPRRVRAAAPGRRGRPAVAGARRLPRAGRARPVDGPAADGAPARPGRGAGTRGATGARGVDRRAPRARRRGPTQPSVPGREVAMAAGGAAGTRRGDHETPLRRLVRRLTQTEEQRDAELLRREATRAGYRLARDCTRGQFVTLAGRLRTVTYSPRTQQPALEAELYDGTGSVTLVWLGRRSIV